MTTAPIKGQQMKRLQKSNSANGLDIWQRAGIKSFGVREGECSADITVLPDTEKRPGFVQETRQV
ncbi:MAG: hypothetical protein Ta2G_21340 [Termitinemataceae bacterium]|nr:MAG: hypothetical protein Ta2G_21340 [Termitinemataceae bacterium]